MSKSLKKLRLNGIVEESIVDGPGLRYVLFTQGCPHHCPGCHNPETHDPHGGYSLDIASIIAQYAENPLLAGVTFSGGEPFLQAEALCEIGDFVHKQGKNIITYTGFTFEELHKLADKCPHTARLLELSDVLVDGPYIESLRNLELNFAGSENQRFLSRADREALLCAMRGT